ncbi:hypothetical protein FOZ62_014837 [Perkinsus olseni]|uniref:Uncharacterized protein n=2 Tax=Perkinsus olseni TaxID=32597 RepID=A0A7J6TTE6_PEROL|nr:hypothetical protein FOZ62_014837 [Perkinsus olseni]
MDEEHKVTVNNAVIGLEPVCSADGNVSPGHIVVIQGFIIAGIILVLLVATREVYLWWCEIYQRHERAVDCSVIASHMHDVRREMRRRVEARWEAEGVRYMVEAQRQTDSEGERPEGSLSPGARGFSADQDSPSGLRSNVHKHFEHGSILSHDPSPTAMFARAHSTSRFGIGAMNPLCRERAAGWSVQVKSMRVGVRKRRKVALIRGLLKTILRAIFFLVVHILACLFVFVVSPRQLFESSWWSILDAARGIQQVGTSPWVFTDLLVLADIAVLIVMGIPAALRATWWPRVADVKPERMSSAEVSRRAHEFSPIEKFPRQVSSVDPDVCAIIAIRSGSCADFTKRKRIAKLVRRCENLFPCNAPGFSRVFVVDHGPGLMPADDCWKMLQDTVSPDINYAYLPEEDKAIAVHWANKYWISSQVRRYNVSSGGVKVPSFRYALVIDDVDGVDDLLLPTSMELDTKSISSAGNNVVWFPSTVRPTIQGQGQSVWVDDYLLKADAIVSLTQQKLGRSAVVVPQKSVCLWDRKALFETMEKLSGTDGACMSSSSELTQRMSITQMRLKGASTATAAPQVRVTNHDQFGSHCKDWRLLCTLVWEFINPFVSTRPRWAAKFSIALYYLVPAFFVVVRPFYLGTLLLRAPIDIPILLGIYYLILNVLSVIETCSSLRRRPEIKRHWKMTLLLFAVPLYKLAYGIGYLYTSLFHSMFKICSACPSVKEREKQPCGAGVPPLPGSATVDWFSVWVSDDDVGEKKGRSGKTGDVHRSGGVVWTAAEKSLLGRARK